MGMRSSLQLNLTLGIPYCWPLQGSTRSKFITPPSKKILRERLLANEGSFIVS